LPGHARDYPAARRHRDAKIFIFDDTSEIQRLVIGVAISGSSS
jgi:alkylation response protein AidB-like acyl-CoA dehydrogenase